MFIVPLSVLTFDTCTFLNQINPTYPFLDATINYQTTEMKVNDTFAAIVKGIGEGIGAKKQGKRVEEFNALVDIKITIHNLLFKEINVQAPTYP